MPQRGEKEGEEVVKKAMDYINKILSLQQGQKAELVNWEREGNLYKISFKVGDIEYQSFVTKDGKYLFPFAYDLTKEIKTPSQAEATLEKREKPDVKLFVMSYCPFGLQMEKAILPVWELLEGKAEIGIYFVDYIMHGKKEMEENLRQYCIQKEQKEKYLAYLSCFVKEGKFEKCLDEAKIEKEKLKDCMEKTDKEFKISENFSEKGYPPFDVHHDLNEKYQVTGSPTLVINDKVVAVQRSPEKIKEKICQAFLSPPPECEKKLSEKVPSSGFGNFEGESSGQGQCK